VTDQAGKPRRSLTDALGRLTRVDEPNKDTGVLGDVTSPVQPTSYIYEALDDLKTVTQGGQTRSFSYDSLKRLTSATNPDSGTVNYTSYDGNGNLLSKTDARGMTTNYVYDALNRLTNKTYQNDPSGTPAVSYTYDATSVSNSKGRLTQVGSTVSTTNYTGYDAMGRVTASSQSTNGQTYTFAYGYNLAGGMTSETYPSGRVVNTNYDGAGRVNGVTGTGSRNYATSILYAPQGGMTSLALGNMLTESTAYNNRLQPTSISVGTLVSFGYIYGTSNNNGNVQSQTITAPGLSLTQTYGYDWLNRLTGMNETSGWSETFSYDPYGNRTGGSSSSSYMPLQVPTINAQTNKISAANHSYDPGGNLTQGLGADGLVKTYTYDADNRLLTFNGSAGTYSYDGDGRRVMKVAGSATTVFVYDARGQMVAEYSNPAPPTSGGTSYITADHLGSTRLVTDSTGTVIARHDYAPFGEEISSVIGGRGGVTGYGVDEGLRQKFTGKERDAETGLDYYGARYYGSNIGKFASPDLAPITVRVAVNPQRWNRYSFVINSPITRVDPNGYEDKLAVVYFMRDDILDVPRKVAKVAISPMTVGRLYMFANGKTFETTYMEPPKDATPLHPKGRVASGEYSGFFKAHLYRFSSVLSVLALTGEVPASVDGESYTGISLHGGRYADNSEGCPMYSKGNEDRDQALELIDSFGLARSKVKFTVIFMEGQWDTPLPPPINSPDESANGLTMPPPTVLQQYTCSQDPVCSLAHQIMSEWERKLPSSGPWR
jgi:RHS repeat-associated protein